MIDYIKGELADLQPTTAIIEAAGVGYEISIALPVFTDLGAKTPEQQKSVKLFVTEIIREDAHLLFGFLTKAERELFLLLTTVSGIGPNTARMIMSSYSAAEIRQIIATGNIRALSAIKGIGGKTAQRIIVDLKDKVLKIDVSGAAADTIVAADTAVNSGVKEEAVSALIILGFAGAASGKVVDKILQAEPTLSVDQVIRKALKML